ncbi:MAG: hypothetical protein IJD81_00430 [Oscillospiraceae bacterium]|nr:hypothetical protein [Oscillospiraceae bacterium]
MERNKIKQQLITMVVVGLVLTVYAALHQNTILAIIIFVAQGTLGSTLNAKYRNEVFFEISELDEGIYNDLRMVSDISPKAAEKEGRPYPAEIAAMLNDCLRVQKLNTWMPIIEVALFFVMQIILFAKIG